MYECVCLHLNARVCVCVLYVQKGDRLIHHPIWFCRQAWKAALWMWHSSPTTSNIKHMLFIPFPNAKALHLKALC